MSDLYLNAFKPVFNSDVTKQNIQANYQEIKRRLAEASREA